jgi:Xaa-Pro aminopeptidase
MSKPSVFSQRRIRLADLLPGIPVLLGSGCARTRNYRDATYPFRASSHYLYFGGPQEPEHMLLVLNGDATLYRRPSTVDDEVWHGKGASDQDLAARYEYTAVKSLDELSGDLSTLGLDEVLSVPSCDPASNRFLASYLGRIPEHDADPDTDLVDALIECRLRHDEDGQERLRQAAAASMAGQRAVMQAARAGAKELALRGVLEAALAKAGAIPSFQPIISTAGEVLHNPYYQGTLQAGELLLIDAGGELEDGWSGDLTRVVPVSGSFSPTQRALYQVVDRARQAGVDGVAPGVHFRDLHRKVATTLAQGLVELGILKGEPADLVSRGVHALFFPHGLGHLVGLDVHDLEDLGDRAGYGEREERSTQFGLSYLRLSRELEEGMAVTIEPGYYNIPALLEGELGKRFEAFWDREVLAKYSDVRGIRLEDMVLVTAGGGELLSAQLPVEAGAVETLLATGR